MTSETIELGTLPKYTRNPPTSTPITNIPSTQTVPPDSGTAEVISGGASWKMYIQFQSGVTKFWRYTLYENSVVWVDKETPIKEVVDNAVSMLPNGAARFRQYYVKDSSDNLILDIGEPLGRYFEAGRKITIADAPRRHTLRFRWTILISWLIIIGLVISLICVIKAGK